MQHHQPPSTTTRYIPSVSDLCGTDEIEFLLDDIRDLEPVNCRLEDIQDFEIAGSRTGALSVELSLESPLGTVHSWDSHAHYRQGPPHRDPGPIQGVPLLCDVHVLKNPTAIVKLLLVISSAACLACLCSSGTVKIGLFLLPLVGRLRLMLFVALCSLFVTCLLLFLDISHIAAVFPFNWPKLNTWLYLSIGLLYLVGSSLLLHMVLLSDTFSWVPRHSKEHIFASGILGYICAIESFAITMLSYCASSPYTSVHDEHASDLCLQERLPSPSSPMLAGEDTTDVPDNVKPVCYAHHGYRGNVPVQTMAGPVFTGHQHASAHVTANHTGGRGNRVAHSHSYQFCEYQAVASTSRAFPYDPHSHPHPSTSKSETFGLA